MENPLKSSQNSLNPHRKNYQETEKEWKGSCKKNGTKVCGRAAVTGQGECFLNEGFGLFLIGFKEGEFAVRVGSS